MHKKIVYDKVLKKYFFYEDKEFVGGSKLLEKVEKEKEEESQNSINSKSEKLPKTIQVGKGKKSPFSTKLQMLKSFYKNIKNKKPQKQDTTTSSDSDFF